MGIMDMFTTQKPPVQQPAAGAGNQPAPAPGTPGGPAKTEAQVLDPKLQKGPNGENLPGTETSPLDSFKDLWHTEPDKNKGPKKYANYDPAKLAEAAKKMSYSGLVPKELAAKALSGDVESFHAILDATGQAGFTYAFGANSQMMERMAESLRTDILGSLPSEVRKQSLADSALSKNPKLNHPAVRPIVEAIQQRILEKHPEATQEEVQSMAASYMTEMFKLQGSGETKQTPEEIAAAKGTIKPGGDADFDWGEYLGMPAAKS